MHLYFNTLNSNLDDVKNEIVSKSTIPEFVSYNEQGNNQLIYKDDNGFMIISGWYHTYGVQYDATNALYNWTVAFETPFVTSDYVICATPRYIAGLPNVVIVKTTATSVTIGCDTSVNGIWINWVAMGRWK